MDGPVRGKPLILIVLVVNMFVDFSQSSVYWCNILNKKLTMDTCGPDILRFTIPVSCMINSGSHWGLLSNLWLHFRYSSSYRFKLTLKLPWFRNSIENIVKSNDVHTHFSVRISLMCKTFVTPLLKQISLLSKWCRSWSLVPSFLVVLI